MSKFSQTFTAFTPVFASSIAVLFAYNSGISFVAFTPNLIACVAGMILMVTAKWWVPKFSNQPVSIAMLVLGILILTLFSTGDENIHRWVSIGPIRLNVSMAFAPLLILGLSIIAKRGSKIIFVALALAVLTIYAVQPDASQAIAVACATTSLLLIPELRMNTIQRTLSVAIVTAITLVAWLRPDPLQPVEHVERILHLMASSFAGAIAALILVAILFTPFALAIHTDIIKRT